MLKTKDIIDEKDKRLRLVSEKVIFPLEKKDINAINEMIEYLHDSQIEHIAEERNLRPGMGMAAIQLGIKKDILLLYMKLQKKMMRNKNLKLIY